MRIAPLRAAVVLAAILAPAAWGCKCVPSSPCNSLKTHEVAFVGTVTIPTGDRMHMRVARLVVEEVFHGLQESIKEVDVDTRLGDCSMPLVAGERYVIFASRADPGLRVHACSGSFNVREQPLLFSAIQEAARSGESRLVGAVVVFRKDHTHTAAAGVRVTAQRDGATLEAKTTTEGEFEFREPAPGSYRVAVADFVPEFTKAFPPVELPAHGCEVIYLLVKPAISRK